MEKVEIGQVWTVVSLGSNVNFLILSDVVTHDDSYSPGHLPYSLSFHTAIHLGTQRKVKLHTIVLQRISTRRIA